MADWLPSTLGRRCQDWAVPAGSSGAVSTSAILAAPSVMASGQLKPPEKLENRYNLTTWCSRLGEERGKADRLCSSSTAGG